MFWYRLILTWRLLSFSGEAQCNHFTGTEALSDSDTINWLEFFMRSVCRMAAFCGLLLNIGAAQVNSPTASELEAMERYAKRPTAHVAWSKEMNRIEADQTQAVITALVVEDATQAPGRMRGIRIDLAGQGVKDRLYVGETFLERLIEALDEVSAGMGSFLGQGGSSRCFGSCAFLSAVREGVHFFHASQCSMSDGWFGLSVSTGAATFRFTELDPLRFASAIARAADALKDH